MQTFYHVILFVMMCQKEAVEWKHIREELYLTNIIILSSITTTTTVTHLLTATAVIVHSEHVQLIIQRDATK